MKNHDSLSSLNHRRLLFFSRTLFQKAHSFALLLLSVGFARLDAAQLKEARVTQVIRNVELIPARAAPRPAAVSDQVRDGTAVRTLNSPASAKENRHDSDGVDSSSSRRTDATIRAIAGRRND
jgi:hypothetical protein